MPSRATALQHFWKVFYLPWDLLPSPDSCCACFSGGDFLILPHIKGRFSENYHWYSSFKCSLLVCWWKHQATAVIKSCLLRITPKFVDTQAMTNSYSSLLLIAIVTHDVFPFQISSECEKKKSVLELMTYRKNFRHTESCEQPGKGKNTLTMKRTQFWS